MRKVSLNLLKILISPLAFLYLLIVRLRNWMFDIKIFRTRKVNATVFSVGNLTVGGTGKTPTVIYLTKVLKGAGKNVGILSRGYRRKTKGYLLVADNEGIKTNVMDSGDEIFLATLECGVPSAVAERRVSGTKKFLSETNIDTVVLDDAFQHRWIYRDFDILMFDQKFLCLPEALERNIFPVGRMREPFSSVKRADLIIINRKFSAKSDCDEMLFRLKPKAKIFHGHYEATGIFDVKDHRYYELKEFQGQKSLVVCGIAKPFSFLKVLENSKIDISNKILFYDHKKYSSKEIQYIRKKFYETNSFSVLATQKDAVKLTNFSKELDDIDIYYLKIEFKMDEEEEFKKEIFNVFHN